MKIRKPKIIVNLALRGLIIWLCFTLLSCSYEKPANPVYNVTQKQLDAATIIPTNQDTAIVGDPFNGFTSDTVTSKHKLRDIFASIPLTKDVKVGTIMARKAYYYPWGGRRDSLINIVVMVKREPGYYPDGGDWEYIDIKYNDNTNYLNNPNGILPDISNTAIRGRITKCANCHAMAGSRFLFHRDR